MIKFFVWLCIFAAISPVLGMVYVVAEIVWLLIEIASDEKARQRKRSIT